MALLTVPPPEPALEPAPLPQPPARYLAAAALARQARWAAAAEEFESLAAWWQPMADRCRLQAGLAYEQLGAAARGRAERTLVAVADESFVFVESRFALARIRAAGG